MIGSKLEKAIFLFVGYGFLILFRFILPISEPPSSVDKYVVVVLSVLVTSILYRVYLRCRNKHIFKNISFLLETNQLEDVQKYINKWFGKHKKSCSIYMYKLYVTAMCGQIVEFEKMLLECERVSRYKKILTFDSIEGLKVIIGFLKSGNSKCENIKQQNWLELMNALCGSDPQANIPILLSLYSTNYGIIKTVLAIKLHLTYLELDNTEKAEYYYNQALKCAPSLEVMSYIENVQNIR